jgi:hypothetical protein
MMSAGEGQRDFDSAQYRVTVRGVDGHAYSPSDHRMRVIWREGGQVLEATGAPYESPEELAAVVADLQILDEASFAAIFPPGVGSDLLVGLRSYPLDAEITSEGGLPGGVSWSVGGEVLCSHDDGSGRLQHPVDPVTGCFP